MRLMAVLLLGIPFLSQAPRIDDSLVLAPLYVSYTTDSDEEFSRQVQALKTNIGTGPGITLGFASFLHMTYPASDSAHSLDPQSFKPMLDTLDTIVARAQRHQLAVHVSIVSGFFHNTNDLRKASVTHDVRNAQWFSDGWIGEPSNLAATTWITLSRYARALRSRMEEGARILGVHLAAHMAKSPDTLVSVSGDGEVEFSYERNIEAGERRVASATRVYADYSPFMVEDFRDWIRTSRYNGDLTPATDDNRDGRTFNRDFRQSMKTWKLRYYESSGPIPLAAYLDLKEKLPSQGSFFIEGGFDAPRTERSGDAFWDAWIAFRKQVIANYVRDFATWITTSPDPVSRRTVPANRFYSHQIPADFLFGDPNNLRLKTSASSADSAMLGPLGSAGVTVFNTYDGKAHKKTGTETLFRKLSASNWGILEYNPSVPIGYGVEPSSDVEYYLAELRLLARFRPRVIVPFAWTREPSLSIYRIQGRAFEAALKRFVAAPAARVPRNGR